MSVLFRVQLFVLPSELRYLRCTVRIQLSAAVATFEAETLATQSSTFSVEPRRERFEA